MNTRRWAKKQSNQNSRATCRRLLRGDGEPPRPVKGFGFFVNEEAKTARDSRQKRREDDARKAPPTSVSVQMLKKQRGKKPKAIVSPSGVEYTHDDIMMMFPHA